MKIVRVILLLILAGAIAFGIYWFLTQRTVGLQPRPPGPEGSVRWAYDAALPRARSELAADAVPVELVGEDVLPDGRLAANTGKWVLHFSSFTARQRVSITVDHQRNLTVGAKTAPGVIRALGTPPGRFPDSTDIFATTTGKGAAGPRMVVGQVECKYDSIVGSHVWLISFRAGTTTEQHVVRWDGIWLEKH
jgi:hypothetical protein